MKIMIVGRVTKYNAEYFYSTAFRELGHEVLTLDMFAGIRHRLYESLLHSRTELFRFSLDRLDINRNIYDSARGYEPDAIIIFRGELISIKSLKKLRENFRVYLFYPDVFKFLHLLKGRMEYYDAIFTAANETKCYLNIGD